MAYSVNVSLSDFDDRLLQLAAGRPSEERIRAELGVSAVRFYQRLNSLLDDACALEAYPSLVMRLRRLRDKPQM